MLYSNVTCSCGHSFSADISQGFCYCDQCGRRLDFQPAGPDDYTKNVLTPAPAPEAHVEPDLDLAIDMSEAPEPVPQPEFSEIPDVPVQPDYAAEATPGESPEAYVYDQPEPAQPAPVELPAADSIPEAPAQPVPVQPVQPAPAQPAPFQPPAEPAPGPVYVAPPMYNAPVQPAQPMSYSAPGAPPTNPFAYAPVEAKADLDFAVQCLNSGNFKGAQDCLELLKTAEPNNPGVWFTLCRLLAAQKPLNIRNVMTDFIEYAEKCMSFDESARGNLTLEFNRFLDNMINAISSDRLYIAPYDSSQMSEPVPSVNYQPFGYVDAYYSMLMSCIERFRGTVNGSYRNDYFLNAWDRAYFSFAHTIVQKLVTDVNQNKSFYWYKVNLKNRSHDDTPLRALCEVIYGFKAAFISALGRTPYRDAKANCVNRIVYLNNWLLKMKYINQNGVPTLLVPTPAQRTQLDRESRYYRQLLAKS